MKPEIKKLIEKYENILSDKTIVYSEETVRLTQHWILKEIIGDLKKILMKK